MGGVWGGHFRGADPGSQLPYRPLDALDLAEQISRAKERTVSFIGLTSLLLPPVPHP